MDPRFARGCGEFFLWNVTRVDRGIEAQFAGRAPADPGADVRNYSHGGSGSVARGYGCGRTNVEQPGLQGGKVRIRDLVHLRSPMKLQPRGSLILPPKDEPNARDPAGGSCGAITSRHTGSRRRKPYRSETCPPSAMPRSAPGGADFCFPDSDRFWNKPGRLLFCPAAASLTCPKARIGWP